MKKFYLTWQYHKKTIFYFSSRFVGPSKILTASEASRSPAQEGTKEMLPGVLRFPADKESVFASFVFGTIGISLEYTTRMCVMPRARSSLRMTRASGHASVSERSASSKSSGCSLFPVPIALRIGIPAACARTASSTFAETVSTASITTS